MRTIMKKTQKGFSLVELMVVIAIIAILAAVAIPMYSNYTSKAKITAVLASVGTFKADASNDNTSTVDASALASVTAVPTSAAITNNGSSYTEEMSTAGVILLTFTLPISGTVTITPTVSLKQIIWVCTSTLSNSVLPSNCAGV
jgi:type IV pilus assembly protein PilA